MNDSELLSKFISDIKQLIADTENNLLGTDAIGNINQMCYELDQLCYDIKQEVNALADNGE